MLEKTAMDIMLEYLWTPLVLVVLAIGKMLHRHDKELVACAEHQSVRNDLTKQRMLLRKEQREDFQEIRKAIAKIGV